LQPIRFLKPLIVALSAHDEMYLTNAFQVAIAPTLLDFAGSIVEASTVGG
jgi:hypothetical protein